MKRLFLILLCAALVVAVICVAVSGSRVAKLKQYCANSAYASLGQWLRVLEEIEADGEYTAAQNEYIQLTLAELAGTITAAEHFYPDPIRWRGWTDAPLDLAAALGCRGGGEQNHVRFESVLADGALSENELRFIQLLRADVEQLRTALSGDPGDLRGYHLRDGLSWNDVRTMLDEFFAVWGFWTVESGSPYALLNVES